jgi:Tfp pilus assembly protein PilN
MKPVRIDFAPWTVRRALARTSVLTLLLGGAGVLLCGLALFNGNTARQKSNALATDLGRVQKRLADRTAQVPALKKLVIPEAQGNAVNQAIAQLNLPWRDLLDAMEAATPPTIALLVLEPDAKKRALKGTAEAKSSDDMIAYVEQLKQQPFFAAVALTRHEINEQDPNKPVRFQFEAMWGEVAR